MDLNPKLRDAGIEFAAPRSSLMFSIRNRIFDDMLIGNFMRTTLHGVESLYPNFSPYVAKYGDNGGARSDEALRGYQSHYRRRDPIGPMLLSLGQGAETAFRRIAPRDSHLFRTAKKLYWQVRSR